MAHGEIRLGPERRSDRLSSAATVSPPSITAWVADGSGRLRLTAATDVISADWEAGTLSVKLRGGVSDAVLIAVS